MSLSQTTGYNSEPLLVNSSAGTAFEFFKCGNLFVEITAGEVT